MPGPALPRRPGPRPPRSWPGAAFRAPPLPPPLPPPALPVPSRARAHPPAAPKPAPRDKAEPSGPRQEYVVSAAGRRRIERGYDDYKWLKAEIARKRERLRRIEGGLRKYGVSLNRNQGLGAEIFVHLMHEVIGFIVERPKTHHTRAGRRLHDRAIFGPDDPKPTYLEVKSGRGRRSARQRLADEELEQRGERVVELREEDIERMAKALLQRRRRRR